VEVATATASSASTSTALPAHLAHLSAEQLNAPIGSLLADAPEEYRPAKKAKITPASWSLKREERGICLLHEYVQYISYTVADSWKHLLLY